MHVRIRGDWWRLQFTRLKGMAGDCNWQKRRIRCDSRERGTEALDTLLHESLHALFPQVSEQRIARAATDLANILDACGYRKAG